MAEIDRNTITKVLKLLPVLTSDQPGEVAATVAAILRTLGSAGATIHDLVAMLDKAPKQRVVERIVYRDRIVVQEKIVYRDKEPAPKLVTDEALTASDVMQAGAMLLAVAFLRDSEADFVRNMVARAERDGHLFSMTPKQHIWFRELNMRHSNMGAANG